MTTTDSAATARDQARAAALALLATPTWEIVSDRLLALLVRPPTVGWADGHGTPVVWMVLDPSEARALPVEWREPLSRHGSHRTRVAQPDQVALEVAAFTSESVGRLIEGLTRRALEARWTVRHAAPVHDPLHGRDLLAGAAARLPAEGLERIVRPLFVQAAQALDMLSAAPFAERPDTTVAVAGEAAAAIARIACVLDAGSHPPAEWLLPAARETHLGKRITPWLDDLAPAVGGDERAARWVRESAGGVLRETATVLRPEFAGRDWLQDPLAFSLRPQR